MFLYCSVLNTPEKQENYPLPFYGNFNLCLVYVHVEIEDIWYKKIYLYGGGVYLFYPYYYTCTLYMYIWCHDDVDYNISHLSNVIALFIEH